MQRHVRIGIHTFQLGKLEQRRVEELESALGGEEFGLKLEQLPLPRDMWVLCLAREYSSFSEGWPDIEMVIQKASGRFIIPLRDVWVRLDREEAFISIHEAYVRLESGNHLIKKTLKSLELGLP